uniref:60S ribosomal protein L21 n=1 Tax=Equus caballus TaxID=9796 RepID=A0A9L0RZH3_HORSE
MAKTKGKWRGICYLFSGPFRKTWSCSFDHIHVSLQEGDIVDIERTDPVQKGMPHKYYHCKTGRIYHATQLSLGIVVNKQVKDKILAKRINVCIEHICPNSHGAS